MDLIQILQDVYSTLQRGLLNTVRDRKAPPAHPDWRALMAQEARAAELEKSMATYRQEHGVFIGVWQLSEFFERVEVSDPSEEMLKSALALYANYYPAAISLAPTLEALRRIPLQCLFARSPLFLCSVYELLSELELIFFPKEAVDATDAATDRSA